MKTGARFCTVKTLTALFLCSVVFFVHACSWNSDPDVDPTLSTDRVQNQAIEKLLIKNYKRTEDPDYLWMLIDYRRIDRASEIQEDYTKALDYIRNRPIDRDKTSKDGREFFREHPQVTLEAFRDLFRAYSNSVSSDLLYSDLFWEGSVFGEIVYRVEPHLLRYWKDRPSMREDIGEFADTYFQEYLNTPVDEDLLEDEEYLYRQFVGERHAGVLGRDTMVHFIENLPEEEARAHLSEETFERIEFLKKLYDRLETYVEEEEWKEYIDLDTENGDNEEND